ncbi:MAG: hypothetical protein WCV71_03890 [Patescibacteria group bacterium]
MINSSVESFKLVVRPGDRKLRSSDYWAIVVLCSVGASVLLFVVGNSV